jgi:hypothetical protein
MPEPTLAIKYQELQAEIGEWAGWGKGVNYGEKPWTKDKLNRITSVLKSGLRRFYYPPLLQGQTAAYAWSFLKPVASIAFPQGGQWVEMPDDFGQPEGRLTVTSPVTQTPWPLDLCGIGVINELYQVDPTISGRPWKAALTPTKGTYPTGGQQWQLWIYPLADQNYTFQMQYYINPNYLSGDLPYAYGGPEHHETLLESCLAAAEERLDNMPFGQGPHSIAFMSRLAASISMDARLKPQRLGRNLDRSDGYGDFDRSLLHWFGGSITYNGMPL